jgi:hypothetical protein
VVTEQIRPKNSDARQRHVDDTVRVWLGLRRSSGHDVPPLPAQLERRFLRIEEYERRTRDAWGCWDHSFSENFREGLLAVPEVDRWLVERRRELSERTPLEPLWPNGKRFAVCLTHDVDVLSDHVTMRQLVRHAVGGLDRASPRWDPLRYARPPIRAARTLRRGVVASPSLERTLELSIALESRYAATASYFFTVPASGRGSRYDCTYALSDSCTFRGSRTTVADVIRTLAEAGFDVGLHGSYVSAVEPGILAAEREKFERGTGIVARTTRQHFLHWDITRTPHLQEAAGFLADTTLGFNRAAGYRASTTLPFRHFDVTAGEPLDLLEVPLVVEDSALLGPIAGESNESPQDVVRSLVDTAVDVGGAVTFLFHPDKLVHPEWLELYEWSLSYVAEAGGWLTSVAELERWWTARERMLLAT